MILSKHYFLFLGVVASLAVAFFCSNLEAQNYTQTTRTYGNRPVYINTGPQNPLLNNLQAGWETDNIQAQAELARAQAAQIKIQTALMLEQAQQQSRQPQQSQQESHADFELEQKLARWREETRLLKEQNLENERISRQKDDDKRAQQNADQLRIENEKLQELVRMQAQQITADKARLEAKDADQRQADLQNINANQGVKTPQ